MKPYFETTRGQLYHGDSLEVLSGMDSESVQCCITSPPYWGLRDYGIDGQLGLEKTPEEYVSKMVEMFKEVRRVLKKDGTLWLNLGDSYSSGGRRQNEKKNSFLGKRQGVAMALGPKTTPGYKPKNLIGIPWRVAFALQADGWYLRQDIIWHKPNPMPESVTDRCTKSHEYIFLMSKAAKYYYDNEAIKEAVSENTHNRISHREIKRIKKERAAGANTSVGMGKTPKSVKPDGMIKQNHSFENAVCLPVDKRNKRSVWTVPTKPYKEPHFATFPPALILPCILAGTAEHQTILDPFMGAGTVASVCEKYNRKWQGIELNEEYCQLIKTRITNETRQLKLFN